MTTEVELLQAVTAALQPLADTMGAFIAEPGDLPTQPDSYPMLKVRLIAEAKQSLGRGSVGFTATITIRVMGEVSEPIDPDNDILVATTTAKLVDLKRAYERAIINNPALTRLIQQLASVTTQFSYAVQATRLAGINSDFAFEVYQDGSDFFPLELDELAEIDVTDPNHPGAGMTVVFP